ncbi:Rep family protein [Eubacterium sp.]
MSKTNNSKRETKSKSRLLCLLLYPDENPAHKEALECLFKYYNVLAICHNQDVYLYDEFDEEGNLKHSAGELKKSHYHIMIQFQNARYISGVAKELDIEEHLIQKCSSFESYVVYMVHKDEPLKHQYSISDLQGTLIDKAVRVLECPPTKEEQFFLIQNWILSHRDAKYCQLGAWVVSHGCFDIFMRYQSYFKEVFYEQKCSQKYDYVERSKKG